MATNYQFLEPGAAFPGVSATGTVQLVRLGLIAGAFDMQTGSSGQGYAEFVYCQGASASTAAAGDAVLLSAYSAGQAGSANTASQGVFGIAPAALSNTNVFGWVQVMGLCDYAKATNTSTAVGNGIFLGSTLGRIHVTGSATGFRVDGAWFSQYSNTTNSNSVLVSLYYPVYNGR